MPTTPIAIPDVPNLPEYLRALATESPSVTISRPELELLDDGTATLSMIVEAPVDSEHVKAVIDAVQAQAKPLGDFLDWAESANLVGAPTTATPAITTGTQPVQVVSASDAAADAGA